MENVRKPFTISIVTDNDVDSTSKFQVLPWIGVLSVVAYKTLKSTREWINSEGLFSKKMITEINDILTEFLKKDEAETMANLIEVIYEIMKTCLISTEKKRKTITDYHMFRENEQHNVDALKKKERYLLIEYKRCIRLKSDFFDNEVYEYIRTNVEMYAEFDGEECQTLGQWEGEEMKKIDQWKEKEKTILEEWIGIEKETIAEYLRKTERLAEVKDKSSTRKGNTNQIFSKYVGNEKKKIFELTEEEKKNLCNWKIEKNKSLVEWKEQTEAELTKWIDKHQMCHYPAAYLEASISLLENLIKYHESHLNDQEEFAGLPRIHYTKRRTSFDLSEGRMEFDDYTGRHDDAELLQQQYVYLQNMKSKEKETLHELEKRREKTIDELQRKQVEMLNEWKQNLNATFVKLKQNREQNNR